MDNQGLTVFWDIIGRVVYILPLILIIWKGGAMSQEIKQMKEDIKACQNDIDNDDSKFYEVKDNVSSALGKLSDSLSKLSNEIGKLSVKIDSVDERLGKLEVRVDSISIAK